MKPRITVYCDGACSGNQFENNVGGWGAVLKFKDTTKEISGAERNTSNQRMELTACLRALALLTSNRFNVDIYSDSAYLVNCVKQKWYEAWERNGWKTSKKQPVENKDLWMKLLELLRAYDVTVHKVEGHAGIELNERADALARRAMKRIAP